MSMSACLLVCLSVRLHNSTSLGWHSGQRDALRHT